MSLPGLLTLLALLLGLLVSVGPKEARASLAAEEQALVTLINDYRAENGLGALTLNSQLDDAAHWMSQDMATNSYFSHTDSLGRDTGQRILTFGNDPFFALGENIARGSPAVGFNTAHGVFDAWKSSPGHNAAMLGGGFNVIGVGRAFGSSSGWWFWTADFGGLIGPPVATPTATPTATPIPTPAPTPLALTQGNVDCDPDVDSVDALKVQRHVAGLSVGQRPGCPAIGSDVASFFGDVDCDNDIDSVDALKILRYLAGMSISQTGPCPDIGTALTIAENASASSSPLTRPVPFASALGLA